MATTDDTAAHYGFAQTTRAGGLLFCSGQIGLNDDGTVPIDPATQYRAAFEALGAILAAEGSRPADIVELMTFHTHYPEHMDIFMAAKADFLGEARPTWTAIGVTALGYPETLVEIKATARLT